MAFIQKNFILLLILAVVIYLFYKNSKKPSTDKDNSNGNNNILGNVLSGNAAGTNSNTNNSNSNTSNSNSNSNSSSNTTEEPSIKTSGYEIGDNIYAGVSKVNAYDIPDAAKGVIKYFFSKGDLIGGYLNETGDFLKVTINTAGIGNFWLGGYENYYVLSSDVYSK